MYEFFKSLTKYLIRNKPRKMLKNSLLNSGFIIQSRDNIANEIPINWFPVNVITCIENSCFCSPVNQANKINPTVSIKNSPNGIIRAMIVAEKLSNNINRFKYKKQQREKLMK